MSTIDTASLSASTDSVVVTTLTTTSTSLTTSPTTTVVVTDTSTSTSTPDTTPTTTIPTTTSVSSISIPPSTTIIETTPTTTASPSIVEVTSTITQTPPTTNNDTPTPSVIVVTSTYSPDTPTTDTATVSQTSTSSSSSATPSALSASGSGSSSSSGLASGAKIAIAVVIPIVAIAAAFLIGFFLWRKRKARKNAEEQRKNEMAEYGFNPNSDPTLVAGVAAYTDNQSEAQDDGSGYRGWGATSSNRKASTTLGSNGRGPNGPALSESSSQPGGYALNNSPNGASDAYSADPLMNGHPEGGDGVAALAAGGLARNRSDAAGIRRGPSNASSAYSAGHQSEESSDTQNMPAPYYQEEVPYNIYNDAAPSHGPYGDGSYGGSGGPPVIRDVQARRNTRIERAPTFPQTQGGIAQNF
ncbi:hypothetical protein LTR99_002818 [Exophiala xenobiotica]|uniref:Uncharacterized protein n=1 Tax=Vermiconidia calcicola TaxID=1690605 RepID=A0AAV9QDM0_9PEZI|nr:hypothetical protein LTR92_005559 [Exophiala xenobiotica]KAK5530760.1 hypothetical protein LTR23_010160 [Chaetothyriales sp. CCFEE 6169]KAK5538488.1 hypothetical protein LTR25_004030 [Vermiconidia calcicola]KAK5212974.1 hypothetical protein LTR41_001922 [Exophiala xenobiotica]KAK5264150.1 hypothetical protein LTR96_010421 [Exophiala xenobiotica]